MIMMISRKLKLEALLKKDTKCSMLSAKSRAYFELELLQEKINEASKASIKSHTRKLSKNE